VQAVVEQRPDIAAAIQQATSKLNATGALRAATHIHAQTSAQLELTWRKGVLPTGDLSTAA
jgi:hypothetical protein